MPGGALRHRSANFTEEEKIKFLRLLKSIGQVIIQKTTAHDLTTNRLKEKAWTEITQTHNACNNIKRTEDNLKKIWQKLKTTAKTYKAINFNNMHGTGGGKGVKNEDNPVLDFVIELTGRASIGIVNPGDCDAEMTWTKPVTPDEKSMLTNQSNVTVEFIECIDENIDKSASVDVTDSQQIEMSDSDLNCTKESQNEAESINFNKKAVNRRRPLISNNERTDKTNSKLRLNNTYAAKRIRTEQGKLEILELQKEHYNELHKIKMENEILRRTILETLLKDLQEGRPVDAELVKKI